MQSAIFSGRVSHSRSKPVLHAFSYQVYMMYLDLDELQEVFEGRWFWSTRRRAIARFNRKNHLGDRHDPLDVSVRDLVEAETGSRPSGPVRLLTQLSYFGYCFNPISLYYCFGGSGSRLETVVAEVSNTPWGERHYYVLPDAMNTGNEQARQFCSEKKMHVSPFMGMNISYEWLLTEPANDLVVRIASRQDNKRFFGASLELKRQEITGVALARVLLRYPLISLAVAFAIRLQALKLWLKGCPVHAHPDKSKSMQVS